MKKWLIGSVAATGLVLATVVTTVFVTNALGPASAADVAESAWVNGVLWSDAKVGTEGDREIYVITYGLVPGGCSGLITAVKEDLYMVYGTADFAYADNTVARSAGETFSHDDGVEVELCNNGDKNFVVGGSQFRPAS